MAITNQQVRFKLGTGSAAQTSDNGDIIFDGTNQKIYTQGFLFDCKNTDSHAINELNLYADGVLATSFNQILDSSINFVAGSGIVIDRTVSPTTLTFKTTTPEYAESAGKLKEQERVGANNNFVYFRAGVPRASNLTLGNETTPIYIKDGSFIAGSDLSNIVHDGEISFYADDVSVRIITANQAYDTSIRFKSGTGITINTTAALAGIVSFDHNEPETATVFKQVEDNEFYTVNNTTNQVWVVSGVSRDRFGHVADVSTRKMIFNFADNPVNKSERNYSTTASFSANIETNTLFWYDID